MSIIEVYFLTPIRTWLYVVWRVENVCDIESSFTYTKNMQKESKNVEVLNQLEKLSINATDNKHKKLNPMPQDNIHRLLSLDFEFTIDS